MIKKSNVLKLKWALQQILREDLNSMVILGKEVIKV